MQDNQNQPKGIALIFIDDHGHAIAHAADFELSAPGGFSLAEGQRRRARVALAIAVCRAYASPNLVRGMDAYDCEQIVDKLCRKHGCRIHEIAIGHKPQAADVHP